MSRASKRAGFGQQRGATSNKMAYNTVAPNLPKDGDRWIDKDTAQEYFWDKDSTQWIPLLGGYGGGGVTGLVYTDTDVVTTVSSLQTVAYVTASVERTASIIATACINGNASTTMTVTSYVMLNATTVNTIVETVELGDDHITNIDLVIEDVPAGTNDIWVQQTVDTGNWVLYASEQHLYALTFYDVILGGADDVFVATKYNVFGGFSTTGAISDNDQYLPSGSSWSSKTNLNLSTYGASAFRIDILGYVCGGSATGQTTDEYNEVADSFTNKTSLPLPSRNSHDSNTIDSKGYAIGGSTTRTDCDEYDSAGDSWSSKTNKTTGVSLFGTCNLNNKIYSFCGYTGSASQINEEYVVDTWSSKTNAPSPARQENNANSANSYGYTVGGFNPSTYYKDCDEYDASGDSWTSKTDANIFCSQNTNASINNELYVAHGKSSGALTRAHYKYNQSGDSWSLETVGSLPTRRYLTDTEF